MYIVTGGSGFIGANIVAGLNWRGDTDILVVDNLENAVKFLNLRDLDYADYMDKREFRAHLAAGAFQGRAIEAVFHQGACSDTMEYNGRYMMDNNFTYSKELFHFCAERQIPFVYASSAATYGASTRFTEEPANEAPLNVYGYSKLLFDRYVSRHHADVRSTVAGLRYFNVYGPREGHKGRMASQALQLRNQLHETGTATLFEGSGGYGNGEQRRDFVFVDDVVAVNLFLADGPPRQVVCNVGSGASRSFNDVAGALIRHLGRGEIRYRAMPDGLKEKYQSFTEANLDRLRATGYDLPFTPLEDGVAAYLRFLGDL